MQDELVMMIVAYRGRDGRTGFVIVEDGHQWPWLFRSRADAAVQRRRHAATLQPNAIGVDLRAAVAPPSANRYTPAFDPVDAVL